LVELAAERDRSRWSLGRRPSKLAVRLERGPARYCGGKHVPKALGVDRALLETAAADLDRVLAEIADG
jgi:hypothetical protein